MPQVGGARVRSRASSWLTVPYADRLEGRGDQILAAGVTDRSYILRVR